MAYKGEATTKHFLVWDKTNDEPEDGLDPATELSIRLIADGVADDAAGAIAEIEEGWYSIAISAAENDAESVVIEGTCTEAGCLVIGEQYHNLEHPLLGILEDLDTDTDSAAWALLSLLKSALGQVETTESAGGAVRIVYEDSIGGTVRATSTIAQAGDVTQKTLS